MVISLLVGISLVPGLERNLRLTFLVVCAKGAIEYEEFAAWSAENGLQQSSQAFHAGWCAVLGVG